MTKVEFSGQFDRLCRGLDYSATQEQTEAIYRRIGHIALSVWAESVTTLLCDGRKGFLPKLEHVLAVIDQEADAQRKAAVARDRPRAQSVLEQLSQQASDEQNARIPRPGTPLSACIKAFAGRQQAQAMLASLSLRETWSEGRKQQERQRLKAKIARCDDDIARYSPLLNDADAAELVRRYETPMADAA